MEDYKGYETVKERLILAGISQLQKHSVEDLSLRKLAVLCNVSCAAPYKHFKNKEEFLAEIVKYVNLQWTKLRGQIISAFEGDEKNQVIEVCLGYIKFCISNPNFKNIMVMKKGDEKNFETQDRFYFSEEDNLIRKYCLKKFPSRAKAEEKIFTIHSIVYGASYMISRDLIDNSSETIEKVRLSLKNELE